MSDALPIPPRPNEGQYKKLAKDLQHACKSNEPDAVREWAARWLETLARLIGPFDWPLAQTRERQAMQIERQWNALRQECKLAGAQFFIARAHGFPSWPRFISHVRELAHTGSPVSAFEAAAEAIVNGDLPRVRELLSLHPGLVRERSTREHHSTLLHYVSANGIEDFRQKTPPNIVEIASLLLDAGAEVDAESEAYGGGCTTLGLVATSVHPEKAGVQIALLRALLDRGARLVHPSAGGNGQSIVHACLANGQPVAARFLADLGAPVDLVSAAALGRLDLLQVYFGESSEMNRKQLESAFLYACGYGSVDAALFLLKRGVNPNAGDAEGQTALHWASWSPQPEVIRLLLNRGARVDAKDHRFNATPLDTVLWTWAKSTKEEDRERCYEAVALLARAGAQLDRDSGMLEKINSDARMLAALRNIW